jgi:hypothetical protein
LQEVWASRHKLLVSKTDRDERRGETATCANDIEGSTKYNAAGEIMAITERNVIVAAKRGSDEEPVPKVHLKVERISIPNLVKPEKKARQT